MHCLAFLLVSGTAVAFPLHRLSLRGGAVHTGEMTFNADFNSSKSLTYPTLDFPSKLTLSDACNLSPAGMDVAISAATFDSHSPTNNGIKNPNLNELCGKMLHITHPETGVSTMATIVDRKASGGADAIDVSLEVFAALGVDSATGHVQITWTEPGYP